MASSHLPACASAAFVVTATAAVRLLVSLPDAPSPCCFAVVPERLSSPRPAAAPSPPTPPAEEVRAFVLQPPTPELGAGTTRGDALIFASAKRGVLAGSPCFSSDPPIFNPGRESSEKQRVYARRTRAPRTRVRVLPSVHCQRSAGARCSARYRLRSAQSGGGSCRSARRWQDSAKGRRDMRGCKADLRTYQPAPAVATEDDAASDFPGPVAWRLLYLSPELET